MRKIQTGISVFIEKNSHGNMTGKKKQQQDIRGSHPFTSVLTVKGVPIKQSVSKGIIAKLQWKTE